MRRPLVVCSVLAAILTGWRAFAACCQDADGIIAGGAHFDCWAGDAESKMTSGGSDSKRRGAADPTLQIVGQDGGSHPFMQEWETGTGSAVFWSTVKSGTNWFLVGETAEGTLTSTTPVTNPAGNQAENGNAASSDDPLAYYTRQTQKMIDAYAPGRSISNWDSLEILPLTQRTNGSPNTVNLLGTTTTLHLTMPGSAVGPDCVAFRRQALANDGSPRFTAFALSADGKDLTITYTGTLEWAPSLQGPWLNVPNGAGPDAPIIPAKANGFYRVR